MGEEMSRDTLSARDIIQIADPILTDELVEEKRQEFARMHRGDRPAVQADSAVPAEAAWRFRAA